MHDYRRIQLVSPLVHAGEARDREIDVPAEAVRQALEEAVLYALLKRRAPWQRQLRAQLPHLTPSEVSSLGQQWLQQEGISVPASELRGRGQGRWLWEVMPNGALRSREILAVVGPLAPVEIPWPEPWVPLLEAFADALISWEIQRARAVYPRAVPFLEALKGQARLRRWALFRLPPWKPDPVPGWLLALHRAPEVQRWARRHRVFPGPTPLWVWAREIQTPGWLALAPNP